MNSFVVIRDMSAGNAETGEAWQETKIFDGDTTLGDVMNWAEPIDRLTNQSRKRVTITRPHQDDPIPNAVTGKE